MRKIYAVLLCMFFTVSTFAAYDPATLYTINGVNYALDGNKAIVYPLSYDFSSQYSGDIVIPSTVNINGKNHTVVGIDHRAFSDQAGLKSVTLPTTIEWLQEGCFSNSPELESIKFADGATTSANGRYRIASSGVIYTVPKGNTITMDFTNRDGGYEEGSNESNIHYPQYNGLLSIDADFTDGYAATYYGWNDGANDHKVFRVYRGYTFTVSSQAGPIKELKFFLDGRHEITVNEASTGSLNSAGDTWTGREFSVSFDSHRRTNIDSIQVTLWSDSAQAFAAPRAKAVATIEPVCAIAKEAFTNNASTTFTVPASVEFIGKNAISNLGLKELHMQGPRPSYKENPFISTDKTSCKLFVPEQYIDSYKADSLWGRFQNVSVETATPSAITNIHNEKAEVNGKTFNLLGIEVGADYKGIVIRNGKKFLQK